MTTGPRFEPRREENKPRFPEGKATPRPKMAQQDTYLQDGYFDSQGNLRCELLTTGAEAKAKELGNAGITFTQLRTFFTQVRSIERELETKEFQKILPRIQRLEYLVANYVGRGQNEQERRDRESLKRFIDRNTRLARQDPSSFKEGFVPHFEAVVAYFKYHFPTRK